MYLINNLRARLRKFENFQKPKKGSFSILVLFLLLVLSDPALAANEGLVLQNTPSAKSADTLINISGKVSDNTGAPMQGVSVMVRDQNKGTMTDALGNYFLNGVGSSALLFFSHVGMLVKSEPVNGREVINITMESIPVTTDDIVVTGFFKKNKASYTGSALTFTGEQLKSVAPTNVFEALAMLTPGLTVTENNSLGSNPNAIPDILVRGVTSFANNDQTVNQPLIVRDGTIISVRELYDMDINEIATITILKDASAAALYGARAANGVIVIERNKLTTGKMKVIYNFVGSMQFPDFSGYNLLEPKDKLEYERLAGLYTSTDHLRQQSLDSLYNVRFMDINRGVNTDWMSKPSRIGISNDHSIRLAGGAGNARYELNARFGNVEGVMKGDFRKRYGLGFALEYNTPSGFTFTNRTNLSRTAIQYSPYGSFSSYTKMNPYDRVYDDFGQFRKTLSWDMNNPLYEASLGSFSKAMTQNLSNDFDMRWRMSGRFSLTSHINFILNGGYTEMYTSPLSGAFKNITDLSQRGSLSMTNNNVLTYSGNVVLTYNEALPKQSLLTANLGGNLNHTNNRYSSFSGIGFYADALRSINFASSYPIGGAPGRFSGPEC
ncbi:MAG: TonB-dependent receptor plug domain-containing protein [Sphingobacteriales bacterium]|nr:TonB-dependent receptor plug domain-containing protein [Sphingobacteriales bacterium]